MTTRLKSLGDWVAETAELTQPRTHPLVHRKAGGERRICAPDAGPGRSSRTEPGPLPELLPAPLGPARCGPRRTHDIRLLQRQGRRRPKQQLDGSGRGQTANDQPVQRLHARPHTVRDSLLHGPARIPLFPLRRGNHRQYLRCSEHVPDDPDGRRCAGAYRAHGHLC